MIYPNDLSSCLFGDARLVLLGEASHGTHDFYYERAEITKRLIAEKGFTTVAVEADWPDAYRVNRYVDETVLIGFSTYTGTVAAASAWGGPVHINRIQPEATEPETYPSAL